MKEIKKKHSLDLSNVENLYLFGEKFEEILKKITSAKQNSKSIFTDLQKRKLPFPSRPNNHSFLSGPLPGNKQGDASGARRGVLFSRVRGNNFPQQNLEILSPKIYSHIPAVNVCFLPQFSKSFPKLDVFSIFLKTGRNSQTILQFLTW